MPRPNVPGQSTPIFVLLALATLGWACPAGAQVTSAKPAKPVELKPVEPAPARPELDDSELEPIVPVFLASEWPAPDFSDLSIGAADDSTIQASPAQPQAASEDASYYDFEEPQGDVSAEASKAVQLEELSDAKRFGYRPTTLGFSGPDHIVAVGHDYMIAADTGKIRFLDKLGNVLPAKNGVDGSTSFGEIFADFLYGGRRDLNEVTGFPKPCDDASYPVTTGTRYCIDSAYDGRAYYDPVGRRFLLLAHVRHPLWSDLHRRDNRWTKDYGICGVYGIPPYTDPKTQERVKLAPVPDEAHCSLSRRHIVFAMSKTQDPRDGFYLWAVTENALRDFPWASVNASGNTFVIGYHGKPAHGHRKALVVRLSDLRAGSDKPAYFKLYEEDVQPSWELEDPESWQPAPLSGYGVDDGLAKHTLLMGLEPGTGPDGRSTTYQVIAFTAPEGQGLKPPLAKGEIDRPFVSMENIGLGWPGLAVYRKNKLYLAVSRNAPDPDVPSPRRRAQLLEIAVSIDGDEVRLGGAGGFDWTWLGPNTWYEEADPTAHDSSVTVAVNAVGDRLVSYVRNQGLSVHLVRYPGTASNPLPEVTVHAVDGVPDDGGKIDFSFSTVDPIDDRTFWIAKPARDAGGSSQKHLLVEVQAEP